MNAPELIKFLKLSAEGDRDADVEIAKLLGWMTKRIEMLDRSRGISILKTVWINPASELPDTVPSYTTNLQHAYELAVSVAPEKAFAMVIEGECTRVMVSGGEAVYHRDPVLALCIAVMASILDPNHQFEDDVLQLPR